MEGREAILNYNIQIDWWDNWDFGISQLACIVVGAVEHIVEIVPL